MLSKLYILYTFYIYIYIYVYRSFSTTLDKGLRKNIRTTTTKKRDGEIGKHKLNEMGALNIKQKK